MRIALSRLCDIRVRFSSPFLGFKAGSELTLSVMDGRPHDDDDDDADNIAYFTVR